MYIPTNRSVCTLISILAMVASMADGLTSTTVCNEFTSNTFSGPIQMYVCIINYHNYTMYIVHVQYMYMICMYIHSVHVYMCTSEIHN